MSAAKESERRKSTSTLGQAAVPKRTKSRFGCAACKAKRLKCDETKPLCNQCHRRGIQCPGYKVNFRWSTKHEAVLNEASTSMTWPRDDFLALQQALPELADTEKAAVDVELPVPASTDNGVDAAPISATTNRHEFSIDEHGTIGTSAPASTDLLLDYAASPCSGKEHDFSQDVAFDFENTFPSSPHDPSTRSEELDLCHDYESVPDNSIDWAALFNLETSTPSTHCASPVVNDADFLLKSRSSPLISSPIHITTVLVEFWFSDVCAMWSAFDSAKNPNRCMASATWQSSAPVYYAMQYMSAICMVDSLPHVKEQVAILSLQAVQAIERGVSEFRRSRDCSAWKVPTGLLFACFAMGTSACWADTSQLGIWFLAQARDILVCFDGKDLELDDGELADLKHFREALVYWEMLSRVVGWDAQGYSKAREENSRSHLVTSSGSVAELQMAQRDFARNKPPSGPEYMPALVLHPWTGVSTNVQRIFGDAVLLCRKHRQASKKRGIGAQAALLDALRNIGLAQQLEKELQGLRFEQSLLDRIVEDTDTGDGDTPTTHLFAVAEAYRLAALLQLYQTFPDLDVGEQWSDGRNVNQALLGLSLDLISILQGIPAASGSRCIQPILYITAATGLRFDVDIENSQGLSTAVMRPSTDQLSLMRNTAACSGSSQTPETALALTRCTLEVSKGRRFLVGRLLNLHCSLPSRPVAVALNLVKAIWAGYDHDHHSAEPRHWIDIMIEKGLETLFG